MNVFHTLTVVQSGNEYRIITPQGIIIAHLVLPSDGQFMIDCKILDGICKGLAYRWGLKSK